MQCRSFAVVDENGARRTSIVRALADRKYVIPCSSAGDATGLPDDTVVLCAVDNSALDGLTSAMRDEGIYHPIIAYGNEFRSSLAIEALRSGAVEVLRYPFTASDIYRRIFENRRTIERQARELEARWSAHKRISRLSPREFQVLELIARGESSKQIARALEISPRTVEIHRANLSRKLEVRNAFEAVALSATARTQFPAAA